LIKPITDSNTKWKYENERKKKNLILKVAIPSLTVPAIIVSVILFLYVFSPHPIIPQPAKSLQLIGDRPSAVAVNPSTNIAYVANRDSNTVSVIDGKTNRVIIDVHVGSRPSAISLNPSTNIAYVANNDDNTVSVIDGKTNRVRDIK
jgi:YVTN family beta-propeller protein